MKYKITITKEEDVLVKEEGAWVIADERPWTREEFTEETGRLYGDTSDFLKTNPLKRIRGYTPDREVSKSVETKLLEQTVDSLDLPAVIKAINGL